MADSTSTATGIDPIAAFEAASGMNPTYLRALLLVFFVVAIIVAYIWALRQGYIKLTSYDGTPLSFLKLLIKGALLLVFVIVFFVY